METVELAKDVRHRIQFFLAMADAGREEWARQQLKEILEMCDDVIEAKLKSDDECPECGSRELQHRQTGYDCLDCGRNT
jgi:DNA-directed RNA polymerase subunit RPC12/RpoP